MAAVHWAESMTTAETVACRAAAQYAVVQGNPAEAMPMTARGLVAAAAGLQPLLMMAAVPMSSAAAALQLPVMAAG